MCNSDLLLKDVFDNLMCLCISSVRNDTIPSFECLPVDQMVKLTRSDLSHILARSLGNQEPR